MLDDLLDAAAAPSADWWPSVPAGSSLVASCTDDRHPSLCGRVKASWTDPRGRVHEQWLPSLAGLAVRKGDRLLLTRPENWQELVVTGVIDGFADRPEVAPAEAARLELRPDESILVADRRGQPLLEIRQGEHGPVLKLRQPGVALEAEGHLAVRADAITLESSAGPITISSAAHVVVEGEVISLN